MKTLQVLLLFFLSLSTLISQEATQLRWWNLKDSHSPVVQGQFWSNEMESPYHRLPSRAEKSVRKAVWNLSKQSAGLSIRFRSNASKIIIKYSVKGDISMPHMPATGVSGLDLYNKSIEGEWVRSWGGYSINDSSSYTFNIDRSDKAYRKNGVEYQLFLPLYNEVLNMEIGVNQESLFEVLPLRKEKPIVAYGTSICQGACASRPGMAWTNILERKLGTPVINLGFSGNGRLEPEVLDLMLEIDASIYILDCLPNLDPDKDDTYQLILNAVKKIRKTRHETPVILTAHIGYANASTNAIRNNFQTKLNNELKRAFDQLISEGYSKILLLRKQDLALKSDSYVDSIHPNDLGMMQYADAYEKLIKRISN